MAKCCIPGICNVFRILSLACCPKCCNTGLEKIEDLGAVIFEISVCLSCSISCAFSWDLIFLFVWFFFLCFVNCCTLVFQNVYVDWRTFPVFSLIWVAEGVGGKLLSVFDAEKNNAGSKSVVELDTEIPSLVVATTTEYNIIPERFQWYLWLFSLFWSWKSWKGEFGGEREKEWLLAVNRLIQIYRAVHFVLDILNHW